MSCFKSLAIYWAMGDAQENPNYVTGYNILSTLKSFKRVFLNWFIQKKGTYRKRLPTMCLIAFRGETRRVQMHLQCLFSDGISANTGCRSGQLSLRDQVQPLVCGSCHSASPERAEA